MTDTIGLEVQMVIYYIIFIYRIAGYFREDFIFANFRGPLQPLKFNTRKKYYRDF